MKKILFTVTNILLTLTLIQGQIGNQPKQVSKTRMSNTGVTVSLAGSWSGTQTNDNGLYPQAFAFQLTDRGVFSMSDNKGVVAAQGTYSFVNNVFNASYKQLSSSETFSMTGTYDAATQKLTCTQGSGTAVTGQGKITVSRVGGQAVAINNSNLNTNISSTIKPGVKTVGVTPPATTPAPQSTGSNYGTTMYNSNTDLNEYYLKKATVNIWTGNDNKEAPACVTVNLLTNTASNYRMAGDTSNINYIGGLPCDPKTTREYAVNSKTTLPIQIAYVAWDAITFSPDYRPGELSLSTFNKNGLSLIIIYSPRFFTDAWKIDRVELTVEFKKADGSLHPQFGNKTITFRKSALMTETNNILKLVTDKYLFPLN